jgi:hypothetical protein
MKIYLAAAGALLIGTSALAYDAVEADKLASLAATQQLKAAVLDVVAEAVVAETARAVAAASAEEAGVAAGGDPDLDLAVNPNGMGGPLEEVTPATAAVDLTPRPAAQNYPPCRPGPGDDSCIQLYEPGVREELASWNRPTGGLGDGQPQTAMGGPYEPVEGGTADTAMNGDGALDVAIGEAPADEVAAM